ncbi:MAG: ACP phosphodiesterase [Chitinophagaceae bacterium]|nr:ACP phosphodiesterase [Chitinophagaceae bacterium]
MNYLAHAYLSFGHPEVLVGNMISDFVKGRKKENYATLIQKGILLHRSIDTFTDQHVATRTAKQYFRPYYRLYAGAFVDIVYDHFLARDAKAFPGEQLMAFSGQTYAQLDLYQAVLPERFSFMLPYMKAQNWLYNYQYRWGIQNSFAGLVRRAAYMTESAPAFEAFESHYKQLQECYDAFFPDVEQMAWSGFQAIFRV